MVDIYRKDNRTVIEYIAVVREEWWCTYCIRCIHEGGMGLVAAQSL